MQPQQSIATLLSADTYIQLVCVALLEMASYFQQESIETSTLTYGC